MIKQIPLFALLYFTFTFCDVVAQEKLYWVSIGANSGELGTYPSFSFGYKTGNLAFEVGGLTYFGGIKDYPIPHNDFTYLKDVHTASLGFDGLYYLDIKKFGFFAGIGVYIDQIRGIADSNVSNRRFTQDTSYKLSPAFSTGINIRVPNKDDSLSPIRRHLHSIGVGYNTIRGINVRLVLF